MEKRFNKLRKEKIDEHYIQLIRKVIDAYQPDVIHCWGSELCFGLIAKYTDIPVVMHIQGIINPIYDAYCPAGMSGYSILKSLNFNFRKFYNLYYGWHSWMPYQAKREAEIFKNTHYFLVEPIGIDVLPNCCLQMQNTFSVQKHCALL